MGQDVQIVYTNHRGETAVRKIRPVKIWFGATEYHETEQWLLQAFDLDRQAERNFSMKDIKAWL
jgi:predicted DNA-binding transcriptional regulator YafY